MISEITQDLAREILESMAVCYSEGNGGDLSPLLIPIKEQYPRLAAQFAWLPWDQFQRDFEKKWKDNRIVSRD